MSIISDIVLALSIGAGAIGTETVKLAVKDAYGTAKDYIAKKYPAISLNKLENDPSSALTRGALEEDLIRAGAGRDGELLKETNNLLQIIILQAPEDAKAAGFKIEDLKAVNLRLNNVVLDGDLIVTGAELSGDAVFENLRVGSKSAEVPINKNTEASKKN